MIFRDYSSSKNWELFGLFHGELWKNPQASFRKTSKKAGEQSKIRPLAVENLVEIVENSSGKVVRSGHHQTAQK